MKKKSLRIAVLGTRGIPDVMGGVETHCQNLYPGIVARGHHVTLYARKNYVEEKKPYSYNGIRVIPIWAPKKKSIEAIYHTLTVIIRIAFLRNRYNLVHIHAIGPGLLVPIARALGLKVVFTHHGLDYDRQKWGKIAKIVLRLGERFSCKSANAVITVSKHIKNQVEVKFQRKGIYIPNGVEIPKIIPSSGFLEKYKLQSKKYILAVGRIVPEKGFHDLVEAFSRIDTTWKLVIAGAADFEDDYSRNLTKKVKSISSIEMIGFVKGERLGEIFSNAGLFILPSYHEGLPIVLLEAISYNLPIIVSDIPANRELSKPEETFSVGDVEGLTQKIILFLSNRIPTICKTDLIKEKYDWESVISQTESVYFSLYEEENVAN
ncbi:MAG: glycosyltransferase family 4 protein [Desulfopila sp.]